MMIPLFARILHALGVTVGLCLFLATPTKTALATAPLPGEADHYDLVVYGGTPAGMVAAVRAAREGLGVLLVSPWPHLGGILANGLSTMDTA